MTSSRSTHPYGVQSFEEWKRRTPSRFPWRTVVSVNERNELVLECGHTKLAGGYRPRRTRCRACPPKWAVTP